MKDCKITSNFIEYCFKYRCYIKVISVYNYLYTEITRIIFFKTKCVCVCVCEKLILKISQWQRHYLYYNYFHISILTIPKLIHKNFWRRNTNCRMTIRVGFGKKQGWEKRLTLNGTQARSEKFGMTVLMVNLLGCQVKFKPWWNFCVTPLQFNLLSAFA